jgi:hypothetical protein
MKDSGRRTRWIAIAAFMAAMVALPGQALASGTGSFSPTESMGSPRYGAAAALLADGRVLVAGGRSRYSGPGLSSAEVFNPANGSFSGVGSMTTPRLGAATARLRDGRVLIAGGWDGVSASDLASAEVFDPASGQFSGGIAPMNMPRAGAVADPLPDGRVLVVGGTQSPSSPEVYSPTTNTWSSVGPAVDVPGGAASAPLSDGRILFAGGVLVLQVGGSTDITSLATASIFNPTTDQQSPVSAMHERRVDAVAAGLPDGRVLVAGGGVGSGASFASAEAYDPQANTWTTVGGLTTGRDSAAASPLADGRVLVAGGLDSTNNVLSSAEVYAASNTFTTHVRGKRLLLNVQASGQVTVSEAGSPALVASVRKRKGQGLLRPSSASGDPPTIAVQLPLTKIAKRRLKLRGKLKIKATVTFKPLGGPPMTKPATLKIKRRALRRRYVERPSGAESLATGLGRNRRHIGVL